MPGLMRLIGMQRSLGSNGVATVLIKVLYRVHLLAKLYIFEQVLVQAYRYLNAAQVYTRIWVLIVPSFL
jgi:hypothetical protein